MTVFHFAMPMGHVPSIPDAVTMLAMKVGIPVLYAHESWFQDLSKDPNWSQIRQVWTGERMQEQQMTGMENDLIDRSKLGYFIDHSSPNKSVCFTCYNWFGFCVI